MNMQTEIQKIKEKCGIKIQTVKEIASERNIGGLAICARLQMLETVLIPSILVNVRHGQQ